MKRHTFLDLIIPVVTLFDVGRETLEWVLGLVRPGGKVRALSITGMKGKDATVDKIVSILEAGMYASPSLSPPTLPSANSSPLSLPLLPPAPLSDVARLEAIPRRLCVPGFSPCDRGLHSITGPHHMVGA